MTEAKPTTSTDAKPKIEVVEKAPKKGLKVEIITEKPPFFSAPRRFAQTMMRAEARLVAVAGGALALGAMVLLFFVLTIAKLGPQVLNRPL